MFFVHWGVHYRTRQSVYTNLLSSLPLDCKVELEALNSTVYPTLREQCNMNGCQLVVVDLVWGTLQDQTHQSVYRAQCKLHFLR